MKTTTSSLWAAGVLGVILAAGAPAFAQSHGGGGHMGGGGGGAHMGGGGGARMGGGGHAFGGGARGFGGPHFATGGSFAGGARYGGAARFAPGGFSGYRGGSYSPGSHAYSAARFGHSGAPVAFHSGASVSHFTTGYGRSTTGYGRSGFVGQGRTIYGPGFGRGGFGYYRPYWHGGYWHGGFWPRAYYGWDYPWFLPVLPAIYATYWWGGIPYYYSDNVYYTWNPGYNGYVVTDPPPTADSDNNAQTDDDNVSTDSGQTNDNGDVYVYPKNGQSDEQTSTDRFECHKWAVAQTGFDPTRGSQAQGSAGDYRRAMSACLDARGYSAR